MTYANSSHKKIILISDDRCDIANIKSRMDEAVDFPCYVWQYAKVQDALDILDNKKLRADLIILDLALVTGENEDNIYKKVGASAGNIPIIVISGETEKEHKLAVKVIQAGATDQVLRGHFYRLIDAIRFALIRTQYNADVKDMAVSEGMADAAKSHQKVEAQSQASIQDNDTHIKTLDQFISWMSGGYSVSEKP